MRTAANEFDISPNSFPLLLKEIHPKLLTPNSQWCHLMLLDSRSNLTSPGPDIPPDRLDIPRREQVYGAGMWYELLMPWEAGGSELVASSC